jgi:hypothetical protein
MKKTLVRLAASMLTISILVLAGGTALGITNQTDNAGNATVAGTVVDTAQPGVTTVETTLATPTKTPQPVQSPGFESIATIATILAAVCIFGIKRR